MKNKKFFIVIAVIAVILMFTGCSKAQSRSDDLLDKWQYVKEEFQKTVETIDSKAEAEVEVKVIEVDSKGFPKKYEFVGLKDGKQFLVYDEDGDLKD